MTDRLTFDGLVTEAIAAPFEGWDFSWLEGRKTELILPWNYTDIVKARMHRIAAMLDIGTGGGEILASLAPFPARTCATETYAPNVPVARQRLESLGVTVYDTANDPENKCLPFGDGEFDLVISRHEAYVPLEVFRLLKPGGHFVTQQCGGYGEVGLIEYFQGTIEPVDWTAPIAARQLEEAGFTLLNSQEAYPEYAFLDIGAVVYYLRAIPWMVEDLTVERHRDRLLAMHQHIQEHGSFDVKDHRILIEARKSTDDKRFQTRPDGDSGHGRRGIRDGDRKAGRPMRNGDGVASKWKPKSI